jgi:hypothetical protein
MAKPKIPLSKSDSPTMDFATNYDEVLKRAADQSALARDMSRTARDMIEHTVRMRKRKRLTVKHFLPGAAV